MSRRRIHLSGLIVATVTATAMWAAWFWKSKSIGNTSNGRIETASVVNLGTVSNGEFVRATVLLHNPGSISVPVGDFRTDCTCMQVYQYEEGLKRPIAKLAIGAGSSQTIYLDLRPGGDPGTQYASALYFRDLESDAGEYRVAVLYTPVARVYAVPRAIAYGLIPTGVPTTRRIEIRSDGTHTEDLSGIASSKPDTFSLAVVIPTELERQKVATEFRGQHLLAFIDITFRMERRGTSYNDTMIVTKGDKEFLRLAVSAQGADDYMATPSLLTLPRIEGGKAVFATNLHFRSRDDRIFQARFVNTNLPFKVSFSDSSDSKSAVANVRYTGTLPANREYTLYFRLSGDAGDFDLPVPVRVLSPDE